jgi:hypothetical protein
MAKSTPKSIGRRRATPSASRSSSTSRSSTRPVRSSSGGHRAAVGAVRRKPRPAASRGADPRDRRRSPHRREPRRLCSQRPAPHLRMRSRFMKLMNGTEHSGSLSLNHGLRYDRRHDDREARARGTPAAGDIGGRYRRLLAADRSGRGRHAAAPQSVAARIGRSQDQPAVAGGNGQASPEAHGEPPRHQDQSRDKLPLRGRPFRVDRLHRGASRR